MGLLELFMIAVSLSMDAFAVSLCKGLGMKKLNYRHSMIIAAFFGSFQAAMPLLGWLLGYKFERYTTSIDHWVAFCLLAFIGGKMLTGSSDKNDESVKYVEIFDIKDVFTLAVATSIDALAVGITFAFLKVLILPSIMLIGVTTFVLSICGVVAGNRFGLKYKSKAEFVGGLVLIIIGAKILLEHLNVI